MRSTQPHNCFAILRTRIPFAHKLKAISVLLTIGWLSAGTAFAATPTEGEQGASTARIATAANAFLATLSDTQRSNVVYDFKDNAQRQRWSNFPTFRRGGLRLSDLTQPQRNAVMSLLSAALSQQGYEKITQIMDGDETLRRNGGPSIFGRDLYYISFVGQPSATQPWMLQFGGHHLGINLTLAGERSTVAPSHTGAEPAIYSIEGKTIRPLGREVDKALALANSLTASQREQAILKYQVRDLVLGPGRDGATIQPEGIKGSALTAQQRDMLVDLASEWIGIQSSALAKARLDDLRKNIADTWFAWSGPIDANSGAYFRIQGPTVHIEYAPQGGRGSRNSLLHTHTIYRDPSNDYGVKWWTN